MKSVIYELKQDLKRLAHEIRETRKQFKDAQRGKGGDTWKLVAKLSRDCWEFRHKHIARSTLRGRTIDQIERPRPGNEHDASAVQATIDLLKEKHEQALRGGQVGLEEVVNGSAGMSCGSGVGEGRGLAPALV